MMPLTRTKPAHGYAASLWQTPIRQQPNVHVRRRPLNLVNKLNHLDATLSQNSTCLRIAQLKITRHIRTLTGHDDSTRKAIDNNLETSVRTHECAGIPSLLNADKRAHRTQEEHPRPKHKNRPQPSGCPAQVILKSSHPPNQLDDDECNDHHGQIAEPNQRQIRLGWCHRAYPDQNDCSSPKRQKRSAADASTIAPIQNHQTQNANNHLQDHRLEYRLPVTRRDWN